MQLPSVSTTRTNPRLARGHNLIGGITLRIRPIRTEADYHTALKEIERIFDAAPNTLEGNRLEVLTTLVEAYEEKHFRIPLPDPIKAILYYMETRGLARRDLECYIGSRARVSEVLTGKKPLTMEMIRNLHKGLGIPAKVLIQPYRTCKDAAQCERGEWIHVSQRPCLLRSSFGGDVKSPL